MKDTPGWFDFADFYDFIANHFKTGIFVEIGVWKGLSIKYLAERSNAKIFGIDTFEGTAGEHDDDIDIINGSLLKTFYKNTKGLSINTIVGRSDETHVFFQDGSIDFLFLDADHHYEAVKKDIQLWYPKVKKGGIISGHDYYPQDKNGVVMAVDEVFSDFKIFSGSVWYKIK